MGVGVKRYIDIRTIMINFPYSTCISSFFGSSIATLFIFKMRFRSLRIRRRRRRRRRRNGDFYFARRAPKLRYYGDVIRSFYWKSAAEHDGGV